MNEQKLTASKPPSVRISIQEVQSGRVLSTTSYTVYGDKDEAQKIVERSFGLKPRPPKIPSK